jgi:mannose-1-phosphate guanylyltransferase/mannose-6-phosphate isomerase
MAGEAREAGGDERALVLAGGSGTRLWPRSTDERPKPFLSLASPRSLLADAFARAEALAGRDGVWVSGRRAHEALLKRELPDLPVGRLLLEPVRRNTAPAIAFAALAIAEEHPDAVLAILPSDCAVRDEEAFLGALRLAVGAARGADAVVTLGIRPTRAEPGYGYLETRADGGAARRVVRFIEKPPLAEAELYGASGSHLWNAGIFVARLPHLLREMDRLAPDVARSARAALEARRAGDAKAFEAAFAAAPSISIDYAVMERTSLVFAVPCDCGWSDLGSWDAVYEFRGGGGANVLEGPATSVGGDGNLVLADGRPIRVIGLSGVAVVDSPDGLLVMRRGASDTLRAEVEADFARGRA